MAEQETHTGRVSAPGRYEGYSPLAYDGHDLTSRYVEMRDGTRIAVDIIRPTKGGEIVSDPLPVLWMHTPYNRRAKDGPSAAQSYPSGPIDLVRHGYVVAVADYRGLRASFGQNDLYNLGAFVDDASHDAYDLTEWFGAQPWSSGKVGMWGCSATGGSQLQAASTMPPSLKALFVLSPNYDTYEFFYHGGVPTNVPMPIGTPGNPGTAAQIDADATPVDGPDGEALLAQAKAEHVDMRNNAFFLDDLGLPYRDSEHAQLGQWWVQSSPFVRDEQIRQSGVAIYAGANWEEGETKTAPVQVFMNAREDRRKMILAPHGHCAWPKVAAENGLSIQTEQLRFFDYWLKGIDNGVMDEPAVTYYTYNAAPGQEWQQTASWPLPEQRMTPMFLGDGTLTPVAGAAGTHAAALGKPAMSTPGSIRAPEPALIFDTAPLDADMQVTGNTLVDLWISAKADVDATAQLGDVAPDGTTRTYQMIGQLRASHRAEAEAPYETGGIPFHPSRKADILPVSAEEPARLRFGLAPMSYIFPAGHRIRLEISFADPAGGDEAGPVAVLTGGDTPSSVTLPVIPAP